MENSLNDLLYKAFDVDSEGHVFLRVTGDIGLDWQDSVKDRIKDPPVSPSSGDRYIITATATGVWAGHEDDIATYFSSTGWEYFTPTKGVATLVEDENKLYFFNGTAWVVLPSIVDHNELAGLDGGTSDEYYHLTLSAYEMLTGTGEGGAVDADSLHTHSSSGISDWDIAFGSSFSSELSGITTDDITEGDTNKYFSDQLALDAVEKTNNATGFEISGGTDSKTLTVVDDASVSGSNTGDQDMTYVFFTNVNDSDDVSEGDTNLFFTDQRAKDAITDENINFGILGILEGGATPTYHTFFQGADQDGDITYTLPDEDKSGVLTSDGSGNLSWTTNLTTDEHVKIAADDTTSGYLEDKLVDGTRSTVTVDTDGGTGAKTVQIDVDVTGLEPTVTKGDITESTSAILTITGGTDAVIGSGVTIEVQQANTDDDGYLSSEDWDTFNGKQDALDLGSLLQKGAVTSVNDDGTIDLPTGATGWGFVQFGDNEEWAQFSFATDGTVFLITNSDNVVAADTDTKACIFDNGTSVRIKNRLGSTKLVSYHIYYSQST